MAWLVNAVDITASASTPGVTAPTRGSGSGTSVMQREADQQDGRDEQRQQHLLAAAQRQPQLDAGLGGEHPQRAPRAGSGREGAGRRTASPVPRLATGCGHDRSSRPVSSRNTSSRLRRATWTSSARAPCSAHHAVIVESTPGSIRPWTR